MEFPAVLGAFLMKGPSRDTSAWRWFEPRFELMSRALYVRPPRGSCNDTLLRSVLRRFSNSKWFLEGFLESPVRVFSKDKVLRRVLRREPFLEGD